MSSVDGLLPYLREALWFSGEEPYAILATYALLAVAVTESDVFETVPYLAFSGPPGSGKTAAGHLLVALTGGEAAANISKAALFRWLDAHRTLLFVDEARHLAQEDYADLLNAGYQRGAKVWRCDLRSLEPRPFNVFGCKVFAAVRRLPLSALESRCIVVEFAEAPMQFSARRDDSREGELRGAATAWVKDHLQEIVAAYRRWCEDVSMFSSQRERQIWAPMFAVGEVAGLLDSLRVYLKAYQDARSLRKDLLVRDRLDALLADLPRYLEVRGLKGAVPFLVIREFAESRLDGERPSDKAIAAALQRRGYRSVHRRDGAYYGTPSLMRRVLSGARNG